MNDDLGRCVYCGLGQFYKTTNGANANKVKILVFPNFSTFNFSAFAAKCVTDFLNAMEVPKFASLAEECGYWKQKCKMLTVEKSDAQKEYEDYMADSKQLEAEYETIIKQNEKQMSKLDQKVQQLQLENDSLQKKLQTCLSELSEKEHLLENVDRERTNLKKYLTQLEQKNDDLERANRIVTESVNSFETMLNQAYEKNALLESEVDEKEKLQIKLQRLMDEARDLKQELKVREQGRENSKDTDDAIGDTLNNPLGFTAASPTKNGPDINKNHGNAIASSTRVTAISIIYDLLRRIDRIESKLADWKKISAAAAATTNSTSTTSELYHGSPIDKYNN